MWDYGYNEEATVNIRDSVLYQDDMVMAAKGGMV